jgi:hypothetical protein
VLLRERRAERLVDVISWATILYGAALTFIFVAGVMWLVARSQPVTIAVAACASTVGVLLWNAILHSVSGAGGFFVDAPIVVFPASWQDTGSGVFALAASALALGIGPQHHMPARTATGLAACAALTAFAVDMYLY